MEKQILQDYFGDLSKLLSFDEETLDKMVEIKSKIISTYENNGKILILKFFNFIKTNFYQRKLHRSSL